MEDLDYGHTDLDYLVDVTLKPLCLESIVNLGPDELTTAQTRFSGIANV